MALENLEPATRIESILDGEDIAPATRLEYFLKQAASGGGSGAAFVINVEVENDEPQNLDRTYNEIMAAIANNQPIQVRTCSANTCVFYILSYVGATNAGYDAKVYDFFTQSVISFVSETADGQLEILQ